MDISSNQINETIREILSIFIGSTVDAREENSPNYDAPLSLTSKERRDAYNQAMREM